jgi:hypothetical protein
MDWRIMFQNKRILNEFEDGRKQDFVAACKAGAVKQIAFNGDGKTYAFDIPSGAEPFARRRRQHALGGSGEDTILFHILGWTKGAQAKYLFIAPDGTTSERTTLD